MRLSLALAAVLLVTPAWAASRDDPRTMLQLYAQANEACRGGSGDEKSTMDACDERDAYAKRLGQLGWCFGKQGQVGAEMMWHRCTSNSLRP